MLISEFSVFSIPLNLVQKAASKWKLFDLNLYNVKFHISENLYQWAGAYIRISQNVFGKKEYRDTSVKGLKHA